MHGEVGGRRRRARRIRPHRGGGQRPFALEAFERAGLEGPDLEPPHRAVAFDGSLATIFWVDDVNGRSRLMSSHLALGETAFSTPREAIGEPVTRITPVALSLRDRSPAVVWAASTGGVITIRIATVDSKGSLGTPSDIAKVASTTSLRAVGHDGQVDVLWDENPTTIRSAHLTCPSPPPP